MRIYDKTDSIYTRYGEYRMIKNKMIYKIRSIPNPNSYYITLEQNIFKNRPFKVISYPLLSYLPSSLCLKNKNSALILQDIITNIRYRLITRKKICLSMEYLIHNINSKNMNCSKLDIQILYRVMNHLIRKNKINSI